MTLNRIYNSLNSIRAEDELKQTAKAAAAGAASRHRAVRRTAVSAAALVLVIAAGVSGWKLYYTPTYAISIDINPSLELNVNRFDRVVDVTGYNEAGVELADSLELKNLRYNDAVNTILTSDPVQGYTGDDAELVFAVSCENDTKASEITAELENCHSGGLQPHCYKLSLTETEAAHELGLTPGKYAAYEELKQYDPDVTADEVQNMTMREIRDRIDSCSGTGDGSEAHKGSGYGQRGYGSGAHHGKDGHGN